MAVDIAFLIRLYDDQPRTVDDLPYTREISEIVRKYNKEKAPSSAITLRTAYTMLMRFRKNGKLPLKKKREEPKKKEHSLWGDRDG